MVNYQNTEVKVDVSAGETNPHHFLHMEIHTARRADSSPLASRRNPPFSSGSATARHASRRRHFFNSALLPLASPPPPATFVLCVFVQLRKQKKENKTQLRVLQLFGIHFLSSCDGKTLKKKQRRGDFNFLQQQLCGNVHVPTE